MDTKKMQEEAKENVEAMKKKAEQEAKKVKKAIEDAGKKTEDYIKKNPAKATAISAGVGAALGAMVAFLMKGKNKKNKE